MMKLIGAGVSFAIAADAMGYAVKGFVSLQAWPTSSEIVEEYANTDVKRIEHAATQIRIRQIKEGIQQFCIPEGAVVEIQSLPKFKSNNEFSRQYKQCHLCTRHSASG